MAEHDEGATLTTDQTPAEEAAAQALARASAPPVVAGDDDDTRAAARRMAERAAQHRADDADDVSVVGDEYRDSVERVRSSTDRSKPSQDDIAAATEWLLSDEQVVNTRKLRVRVGGSDEEPVYVGWVIGAIDVNVIRMAEREAMGSNRAQRRDPTGGYDELKANLRVVAEGTIEPDVKQLAAAQGMRDPTTLLMRRFRFRSGVIANIAAQIMELSGFDTDDVRLAGN
jgi:hypothetical protein